MRALILVLAFLSGPAWPDGCDQLPPPSVTVKRLAEPVSLNTTYSYKSISILASSLPRPEKRVLGLTRGNARVKFEIKTFSYVDRSGRWECFSPQIVVSYGFSPMTVYVAKEFPEGSCAYNEIYQHELRHVATYQEHLASIENVLAETLNRRYATGTPWQGPVGQTQTALQKEMNERWMPYIKREIERVESAQALIDTPEEYRRVAESCNGDIKRLAR